MIKRGSYYEYSSGVWDRRGDSFATCMGCAEMRKFFAAQSDEPPCICDLIAWIREAFVDPPEWHIVQTQDMAKPALYKGRTSYRRLMRLAVDEVSTRHVWHAAGLLCALEIAKYDRKQAWIAERRKVG